MDGADMTNLSRFSLEGKVALITGASRGIGRAAALAFAEAGADVALTSRKQEDLDKVADEIKALGRKALPVAAHVGRMDDIHRLVDQVFKHYGRIDILVNNAGGSPATALCLDAEERLWDSIMNLNLKGVYFLSQAVGRIMKAQGGGKIINVASISGFKPEYKNGIYSIAKTGVTMLTKSMALELAEFNIRVNCIAPGAINTKLLRYNWSSLQEDQAKMVQTFVASTSPMNRIADPDEISGAMLYLASEASSFTTGETVVIDGGQLLGNVIPR
jgi:NAD(P)-dependent dehydrogenase (short-subunit alcohol dehydrogenase family)